MRIDVDFLPLWTEAKKVSRSESSFSLDEIIRPFDEIDSSLSEQGIEVKLEDLESTGGLLSYKGRQVLLYIPDQGRNIQDVLQVPSKGRKFHVSHCMTLDEMRRKGRFERYVATNDLSGIFKVHGHDNYSNQEIEGEAELNVCQNCLKKLNYERFAESERTRKKQIVSDFSINDFFETYSTIFPHMPKQLGEAERLSGYTADWNEVSARIRARQNYTCEECSVNLSERKRLLHVHHKNRVRSDNSASNLRVLCAPCHKSQPFHAQMYLNQKDMRLINKLRREQSIESGNWEDAFKYADSSIHGVLGLLKQGGVDAPVIGYELTGRNGRVIAETEAAWPRRRRALVLNDVDRPQLQGWQVITLEELVENPELLIGQ